MPRPVSENAFFKISENCWEGAVVESTLRKVVRFKPVV